MIGPHGFLGADLAVGDPPQKLNEPQLMFGAVDLSAVEGGLGAVLFRLGQQLERVVGGAGRTAQDSRHQVRIVVGELFHGLGAVIHHLEEDRPAGRGDSGQRASDQVVHEVTQLLGRHSVCRGVGVEDLQEMAEAFLLGLHTEGLVGLQCEHVQVRVVVERDAVEAQVGAQVPLRFVAAQPPALGVIQQGRAERDRGLLGVRRSASDVNVRGVVGPHGRRDRRGIEDPLADRQNLVGGHAREHDVHQALLNVGAHVVAVLGQAAEPSLGRIDPLGALARRRDAEGHVGILGVGKDERLGRGVGVNVGEFDVQ